MLSSNKRLGASSKVRFASLGLAGLAGGWLVPVGCSSSSVADGGGPSTGGKGGAAACSELDESECAKSGCHRMMARAVEKVSDHEGCWSGDEVFHGCHELGCPANMPVAEDPNDALWLFTSGCLPSNFTTLSGFAASEECSATGGSGGGGGDSSLGGQGGVPL